MNDIKQRLSDALMRVCELEGVYPYPGEDSVCIYSESLNDYLVAGYIGQLIESGDMEIKISPDKIKYLMRLLRLEE